MSSSMCNPHVYGAHSGEEFPWDGENPCLCCTKSCKCTLRASLLGGEFSPSIGDRQQSFLSGQNLQLQIYLGLEVKHQLRSPKTFRWRIRDQQPPSTVQQYSLVLNLSACKQGCRPPQKTPALCAHLAVQEAVEDRDKEALEGDKQQSHKPTGTPKPGALK